MKPKPTIAVDLGGTHVRAAVVSVEGVVSDRVRRDTPSGDREPGFLIDLVGDVMGGLDANDVAGVVVGVPGVIDHRAEQLMHAPNLPRRWSQFINETWLGERTGTPVSLANDADLAAVGETWFGAGKEADDVVYVTVSTGVGAGIVLNRRLVRGQFSGGEIGHTIIDRSLARTGDDGTVEGLGSGTALGHFAASAGIEARGADLAALVRSGDALATQVWNSAIEAVGFGIVNLGWLVSPQLVVIGGGVGMNGDLVLPIVKKIYADHGPATSRIEICNAALGDDAALAGGAAWWEAVGRGE
jgi:glucokinase